MPLHDTTALILTAGTDLTPSLPDPTTVAGRTHWLTNTNASAAVWGSIGATPFSVDGANVATLSVPRGSSVQVQSDGTRWVVVRPTGTRRIYAGTAVSNASGDATFTFSPAFPSVPVVSVALQTTDPDVTDVRVTALSASSATVNVRQTPATTVLGIGVLGTTVALAGATVHLHAIEAG